MVARRLIVLAVLFVGCGAGDDDEGATDAGRDASADVLVPTTGDSSTADVGTTPRDSGAPLSMGEPIPAGASSSATDLAEDARADSGDPSSCWDAVNNDDDDEEDCDDDACAAVPACNVGSGTRCAPELALAFDPSSCGDAPATPACLMITGSAFGSPAPWVAGGRLHPGGADFDSGLVVGGVVDPSTRRVVATATLARPTCPAGELCVEIASFGITTTTRFDATTRVSPTVALQMSGARSDLALVIGGSVVTRLPFDAASPEWTLDLRPTGEVVVRNGAEALTRVAWAPPTAASVVIYGRNANRAESAPGGAGIEAFSLSTSLCSIPDAWRSRVPLAVTDPGGATFSTVSTRGPALHRGGDGALYLAFEAGEGRILAAAAPTGVTDFVLEHAATSEILSSDVEAGVERVGDPELFWDGSAWHLFFTGELGDERRVGHATGAELSALSFTGWVVRPSANDAAIDMPSVARSADDRWILAARVERDGGHAIGIFVGSAASGPFTRHQGSLESDTFRIAGGGGGFDADEIGAPSLEVVDGAYHLYYAGRRGTRWGIGLWTSGELVHWRPVSEGEAILRGDGGGFDALGARDPDLLVTSGSTHLFYLGGDGESERLGVASRPRPDIVP